MSTTTSLGFTTITVGAPEGSPLTIQAVLDAITFQAEDRGIKITKVNEGLEMSRDIIVSEAVWSLGGRWDIFDDSLRVWPKDLGDVWPFTS